MTALGREQAHRTGQRLAALSIAAVFHSPLPRAVETAQLLAESLPQAELHETAALTECIPAVPNAFRHWCEALDTTAATKPPLPPALLPWRDLWGDVVALDDVTRGAAQLEAVVAELLTPPSAGVQHNVVVSHGNLIAGLLCHCAVERHARWLSLNVYNCSVNEVRVAADGELRLHSFNDVGHLPYHLHTDNDCQMLPC